VACQAPVAVRGPVPGSHHGRRGALVRRGDGAARTQAGDVVSAERWLPVVGFEGCYEVSDLGGVRSLTRDVEFLPGRVGVIPGRVMKLYVAPLGYHTVQFCSNGKHTAHWVHRLVLAAFVGPLPDGLVVRHLNGDPIDNRLGNLTYAGQRAARDEPQRPEDPLHPRPRVHA